MLVISMLTNGILIVKLRYPGVMQKIRYAFIPAPKVQPGDHLLGKSDAKNTVIEYADLQCPYCARFHEAMRSAMQATDDIRWVFRHFPIDGHPLAAKAAEAAECAGEQGRFWEYNDAIFKLEIELSERTFSSISRGLGLDGNAFDKCLGSGKYQSVVADQHAGGMKLKIDGTPTFFVNGKRYVGAMPAENILKLLGVSTTVQPQSGKTNNTGNAREEVRDADSTAKHRQSSDKKGSKERQDSVLPSEPRRPVDKGSVIHAHTRPKEPELADACLEGKPSADTDRSANFCK